MCESPRTYAPEAIRSFLRNTRESMGRAGGRARSFENALAQRHYQALDRNRKWLAGRKQSSVAAVRDAQCPNEDRAGDLAKNLQASPRARTFLRQRPARIRTTTRAKALTGHRRH